MCILGRYIDLTGNDFITIDEGDEQRCSICGKLFKHSKRYAMVKDYNGLKEIIFQTAHKGCLKIMKRIKEKRQEITDLEWEIYLKSNDIVNDDNIGQADNQFSK